MNICLVIQSSQVKECPTPEHKEIVLSEQQLVSILASALYNQEDVVESLPFQIQDQIQQWKNEVRADYEYERMKEEGIYER